MARRDLNGIGATDLEYAIEDMSGRPGWDSHAFSSRLDARAVETNVIIATYKVFEVLLARWLVFNLFIEVAKSINNGNLDANTQQNWLLFQALPFVRVNNTNPFSALQRLIPLNAGAPVLERVFGVHTPRGVLGDAFDEDVDTFFYVLDEAQVAADQYTGAFSDSTFTEARPVLRPIIQELVKSGSSVIVSGTGFSLDLFKMVLASSVGKTRTTWAVHYETGDFSERETQLAYLSQFFPPSFIDSDTGRHLMTRTHEWLRGRYVEAIVLRR